jgi:hypothetical protein
VADMNTEESYGFGTSKAKTSQLAIACKVLSHLCIYLKIDFNSMQQKLKTADNDCKFTLLRTFTMARGPQPLGLSVILPHLDLAALSMAVLLK